MSRLLRLLPLSLLATLACAAAPLALPAPARPDFAQATSDLTPDPTAQRLEDALAQHLGARIALVLGAEGPGLTDATMAAADACVTIPMAPGIDSLNVAAAAAIACYLVASR